MTNPVTGNEIWYYEMIIKSVSLVDHDYMPT
jgi:hypothetical protein